MRIREISIGVFHSLPTIVFQDGQVQTTETNPKRYTYVFGDEHETYRTATDRFLELESKNKIKVKDIQDAFAVEAMSKEFLMSTEKPTMQNLLNTLQVMNL